MPWPLSEAPRLSFFITPQFVIPREAGRGFSSKFDPANESACAVEVPFGLGVFCAMNLPSSFFFVIYTLTSLLQSWPQLSCGEGHKQTATGGEFSGVYTALPEEPAEKILGTALGLERVTFAAAGNQVAVGIAAGVNPGNHVVEAARSWAEPAGTVEAEAAFARVDAFAQRARLQEIHLFELGLAGRVRDRGND